MDRRTFCGFLAVGLLQGLPRAHGHPEHREGGFVITVHAKDRDGRLVVLVRTPLDLMTGVGLPLRGERTVDVSAFDLPDPLDRGGRTHSDRAASAVQKAFRLEAGGTNLPLTVRAVRLSGPHARPFESFDSALAHIANGPPEGSSEIDARYGFLDIRFQALQDGIPADGDAPLRFIPTLGSAVGSTVTFRIGCGARGHNMLVVAGDGAPETLGRCTPFAR